MSCRLCGGPLDSRGALIEDLCKGCLAVVPISIEALDPFIHSYEYSEKRLRALSDAALFTTFQELFNQLMIAEAAGQGPLSEPTETLILFNDMALLGNELGRRGHSFQSLQEHVLTTGQSAPLAAQPCA